MAGDGSFFQFPGTQWFIFESDALRHMLQGLIEPALMVISIAPSHRNYGVIGAGFFCIARRGLWVGFRFITPRCSENRTFPSHEKVLKIEVS